MELQEALMKALSFIEGIPDAPVCARPLIGFSAYNAFLAGEDLRALRQKPETIVRAETRAGQDISLPTVGIEIECFREFFSPDQAAALCSLGIPHYFPEEGILEINPDYSRTYLVQACFLAEIVKFGVIPLSQDRNTVIVDPGHIHSLHINYGIPGKLIDIFSSSALKLEEKYWEDIAIFSDALSYAFASPERLERGDYAVPVKIHLEDGRLEYRANEFRSAASYRLIRSSQVAAGLLFAYMLESENAIAYSSEHLCSTIWKSFGKEFKSLLKKHGVPFLDMIGNSNTRPFAIKNLRASTLSREARSLIWRYLHK